MAAALGEAAEAYDLMRYPGLTAQEVAFRMSPQQMRLPPRPQTGGPS